LKISKEIKIGIVFVVGLALLYWGINFLKGRDLFKNERTFYAVYDQINGLVKANPVLVNGFRVGQVDDIYFQHSNSKKIIVVLTITNNDLIIPSNSIARIISKDILGTRAIDLILGDGGTVAKEGDTLVSEVQPPLTDEIKPIKEKFENALVSLDSVLLAIKEVFNEKTRKNLEASFENVQKTISNLEHITYNIDNLVTNQHHNLGDIINNVASITQNIKNNNDKIQNIIRNFSDISDTVAKSNLASAINNADKSLKDFSEIMEKINKGEGNLGLLVNNDSLYNNLEKSSKELNELIEDIKLNPKRYLNFSVFGPSKKKNEYTKPKE